MARTILIAAVALFLMTFCTEAGLCGLVLNEIMADPASDWDGDGIYDYRDDEWVEVYNTGPETVDLSGFLLGDDQGLLTYGFQGSLGPGETLVVYGSQSQAWQEENGFSTVGFSMSNSGDTVVLFHVEGSDTLLIDSHTFNTYEADDDRSTGRNPDGTGEWEIFDALNPYTGDTPPLGNGLAPTPGAPNMGATASREATWGRIKAFYRDP
jgi:hypothetical protein